MSTQEDDTNVKLTTGSDATAWVKPTQGRAGRSGKWGRNAGARNRFRNIFYGIDLYRTPPDFYQILVGGVDEGSEDPFALAVQRGPGAVRFVPGSGWLPENCKLLRI